MPVEAGTSTAAESEHVMTAIAAGDVVPTSPVDASIVSLEEFEALQDKVMVLDLSLVCLEAVRAV